LDTRTKQGIVKAMPYADPEKQKEAMRERYRERFATEKGFAAKESERKKAYYATNKRYRKRTIAKATARYYEGKA
jgi:hypothetical protein